MRQIAPAILGLILVSACALDAPPVAAAPAAAPVATALAAVPQDEAAALRRGLAAGRVLPMPRVLVLAARRYTGRVVEAELEVTPAGLVYELSLLDATGPLREVVLDAATGREISADAGLGVRP